MRGCNLLDNAQATFGEAFDSFPIRSGEGEKAVLGIFLHHANQDHYTAIVRDKDEPMVAWHLDSLRWWHIRRLEPEDFSNLLTEPGVAAFRVGCDPERWATGRIEIAME